MIKTNIAFSQVREDPEIDLFLCNSIVKKNKRVLMIGSGGESVFTMLLSPDIESIDLIDANPEQIELIKLKIEAIRQLSSWEYRCFVEAPPESKIGVYIDQNDKVNTFKKLMEESILDISSWNKGNGLNLIKEGVNQIGIFEQLFKELRESFKICPIKFFDDKNWDEAFDKVFNRQKLIDAFGEEAVKYSMSKEFTEHFSDVMKYAIQKYSENYFVDQVFKGEYKGDFPAFLKPENYKIVQENLHKINIINDQFHNYVKNTDTKYDVVHTSNITDWLPLDILDELYSDINSILLEDGLVISRRLNGDHSLEDIVGKQFKVDTYFPEFKVSHNCRNLINFNNTIKENDTSYFYSEVLYGKKVA